MITTLKKVWGIFSPAEQRKALVVLVLVILMALLETAGVVSIIPFLTVMTRPQVIEENAWLHSVYAQFGFSSHRAFVVALGVFSVATVVLAASFKTTTYHIINRLIQLQRHSLSHRLLSRYLGQPYEFFLKRNSAELKKNVLSEVDHLVFTLLQPVAQMVAQGAVVLAMTSLIVIYDPWIAAGALCVVGALYALIYGLVRNRLAYSGGEILQANKDRFDTCQEALGGIREIKTTHVANVYLERFSMAARSHARHVATTETLSQTPLYLVEAVGYSGLILIALYLLAGSDDPAKVLPALGMYGFAAYRMLPAIQIIYRGVARLRISQAMLDAIHQDLHLADAHEELAAPIAPMVPRHAIRLHEISYAYPASPHVRIFDRLSLDIPANRVVAIVGKSGAGKSTLMDLLLGLQRPLHGTMSVDGVVIDDSNLTAWQRSIGYVPQQIYLADASVAQNIAFGVPGDEIDMAAVERASSVAQVHDFVREFPEGYATMLGERGARLSGGQRQRIGIARALYRAPAVLFMDEPTSGLDRRTEGALIDSLDALSKDQTIILISHNPRALSFCSVVIDLDQVGLGRQSKST
ncbi:ABC transporter ATP-binding protein [Variovorax sp.]|uniref:ABC transporter ATP-binding protein n=1 Tax=Variovorax sp. TaxID=1871043 RepID=UPI002D2607D4|nr:ABC transporter ATP-binding protein [Variovorax sp.]HYP82884.1 ABC transporter ATP-binding protein [Variovorax sp.]